jgi:hypothetical protein
MATLKEEISNRGIQGGVPNPNEEVEIQSLDPEALLEMQAVFGMLIQSNPQLVGLVNATAPVLFATMLFTVMEQYRVTDDGEGVEPTVGVDEATNAAIGMIRSVAAAMAKLSGEIAVEPSDAEVEADTDIEPVKP